MSTSEMLQARSFRAITGPELFPPSSTGSRLRRDVVIDSKEIRWIVFVLDGGQARKVVADGTAAATAYPNTSHRPQPAPHSKRSASSHRQRGRGTGIWLADDKRPRRSGAV